MSPLLPIPVGDFTATSQHHQPGPPLHLFRPYNVPGCARKFISMWSSLFLQMGKLRPKEVWKLNDYTVALSV